MIPHENMASNITETKKYFAKNPKHVKDAEENYPLLYANANKKISEYLEGIVIDIGNGGVTNYDITKPKKLILGDIAIPLNNKENKNIEFVNLDIQRIPFKKNSADRIVIQHLLHHLADNTYTKTRDNLKNAIQQMKYILKDSGKILIIEGTVPPIFEYMQRILFGINKYVYKYFFKFPMVFVYSHKTIEEEIKNAKLYVEESDIIDEGKIIPIFGMNMPKKYVPIKHKFYVVKKK